MKKVSLVMQDKDQVEDLKKLRELGVVHLERRDVSSVSLSKALEHKSRGEDALGLIQPYKALKKKKPLHNQGGAPRERRHNAGGRRGRRATDLMGVEELEPYSLDAVNAPIRPELIDLMVNMGKDRKALQDRLTLLARERARVAPWGNFEPTAFKKLAEMGQPLFLYELSPEVFAAISKDTRYIKMVENEVAVYLVVPDREIPDQPVFPLPEKSLAEMDLEYEKLRVKYDDLEKRIKSFADRRPILQRDMAIIQENIDLEAVRASMEKVEDVPSELGFSCLTGFIPSEEIEQLREYASENGWAFIADDPGLDDEVPTKLKNNRWVELLYPITDFLELVPGYREIDISGWFFFFFCIFFGMLFGDAGYGAILFFLAIFGITKTIKTGVPTPIKTLFVLSCSNLLWGILTCTWFGVDPTRLPQFLQDISLSYISPAKMPQGVVDQNLQIFCFSLALFQLSIAHLIGIWRNIRSLKVFAEIGSLAMLWGMYNLVLFLVVSNSSRSFAMRPISLYLLAGGFTLNFIFSRYEGSVLRSVLESFKNIISVVLGITGVFSDIMSYIRLWAVGLAGASIATTVNSMAGPMLGSFLVFLGMLLLVFGHGMNIILNVLSVLVHGIRLNTLEFSGHLGLTWSGTAYRPFAETVKK